MSTSSNPSLIRFSAVGGTKARVTVVRMLGNDQDLRFSSGFK